MDFCSFFAGIGGFELGMQRAGHRRVWACEIDPFARAVYATRFGGASEASDINLVEPGEIPDADVWVGGFPCQDLSTAGKRAGIKEGTRSGLVWKLLDLAAVREPAWIFLENVPGLLSSQKGEDFRALLARLDELGYVGAWRVLDARFFGVPQRRRRVFIVARRLGVSGPTPLQVLLEPKGMRGDPSARGEARTETAGRSSGGAGQSRVAGRTDDLIPFDVAQATHPENRSRFDPGSPSPTLASGNRVYVAGTIVSAHETGQGWWKEDDAAGTLRCEEENRPSRPSNVVITPDGSDVAPTLLAADPIRREGANGKRQDGMRTDRLPVVAYRVNAAESCAKKDHAMETYARCIDSTGSFANAQGGTVVASFKESQSGMRLQKEHGTLDANKGSRRQEGVILGDMQIRRLTPRECERLQGFPDDWTAIPWKKGTLASDSLRYRAIGNAVAVPVIEWIARRFSQLAAAPPLPKDAV